MAACESLVPVFKYALQEDIYGTVGKLLRLSVEKMDRVRIVAGRTLCTIIPHWPDAPVALKEIVGWYGFNIFMLTTGRTEILLPSHQNCILQLHCCCRWTGIAKKF